MKSKVRTLAEVKAREAKAEALFREDHRMSAAETKRMREVMKASGAPTPKILYEQDFTEKRYAIAWEGSDPLETSDLRELKELIEKWAKGDVPDKTVALKAPRVLGEFIERMKGVDAELTGSQPTPF